MILDVPFSDPVRLNQIGAGLERRLEPDEAARVRIARALDLASLDAFVAELTLAPAAVGWRLEGRVRAEAVQTCGLTLEPLPVTVDQAFAVLLTEQADEADAEIEVTLDDDAPDVVEDGKIDLGQYAVEQLALTLDPFPRKPGARFEPPAQPEEPSPFAVLKAFKPRDGDPQG